jgi:hypothetical protein
VLQTLATMEIETLILATRQIISKRSSRLYGTLVALKGRQQFVSFGKVKTGRNPLAKSIARIADRGLF